MVWRASFLLFLCSLIRSDQSWKLEFKKEYIKWVDILMYTVASQNSSLMLAAIRNVWPNFSKTSYNT